MIGRVKMEHRLEYFWMNFIWIIILLPKTLQLIALVIITLFLLKDNKFKFKVDKISFLLGIVCSIHLVSILAAVPNCSSRDRIFAAFNTVAIWFLSVIIYGIYVSKKDLRVDIIEKKSVLNMGIVIILYIIMLGLAYIGKKQYIIFSRYLFKEEWLSSGKELRFYGLMEYSNLIVFLYLLFYPLAFSYLKKNTNKMLQSVFIILTTLVVLATNSRMGILICVVILIYSIQSIIVNDKRKMKYFVVLIILIMLCVATMYNSIIYSQISRLINLRKGSNSTRTNIYIQSIEKTIEGSIIVGNGIKEMSGEIPLGSHSTYIGMFYKTGLLGMIFFSSAVVLILLNVRKYDKNIYKLCVMLAFIYMIFEDLDGANWLIYTFFALLGIYNNVLIKELEETKKNEF